MRLQHAGVSYRTGHQKQLRDFYGGLLGLIELSVPEEVAGRGWVWFATADEGIELHFIPSEVPADESRRDHFCLQSSGLHGLRRTIEQAGYETIEARGKIPGRDRFFCRDPFGNLLEFVQIEPRS